MDKEHVYISNNYQNRATLFIYYLMRISVAVAAGVFLLEGNWASGFATIVVLILMLIPSLLRGYHKMYLPFELDFGIVFFVFITFFLGHVNDFYNRIPLWDKFIHFQSGFLLGVTGYILIYILNEHKNIKLELNPGFISLFAVVFSMAIGVVWEIFEFTADILWRTHYWQGLTVTDTMEDLIAATVGALIFSIVGYLWMKRRLRLPFTPQFIEKEI